MQSIVKRDSKVYSAERVGELVINPDNLTFKLLEKIFGYNGPYRKVLNKFGVLSNDKRSYLEVIDGSVYSDIELETEILWKNCSYALVCEGNKVDFKFTWYGVPEFFGFVKKSLIDIWVLTTIQEYVKDAEYRYKNVCEEMREVLNEKRISLKKFLELYENTVFISYVYELLYHYNHTRKFEPRSEILRKYIRENDYLLKVDSSYVEGVYKPAESFTISEGFDSEKRKPDPSMLKSIPEELTTFPSLEVEVNKYSLAEAKLQCLKNNLRLKTNVLLFFIRI